MMMHHMEANVQCNVCGFQTGFFHWSMIGSEPDPRKIGKERLVNVGWKCKLSTPSHLPDPPFNFLRVWFRDYLNEMCLTLHPIH